MWHTANGTRTLTGAEARLIGDAAWALVDAIRAAKELGSNVQFGIVLFDRLTWQQQLVMLRNVLKPLLNPSVAPPNPTALLEATVAAIYAQMLADIECEIYFEQSSRRSEEGDTEQRQQVIAALEENGAIGNWPSPESVVMDSWELAVCEVRGWVLADEDWQMDGLTLDLPPEEGRELKKIMGIRDDYFTDVPPDANDQQARTAWQDIIELITGDRPDGDVFD